MRRLSNCIHCGKELVANPNVCVCNRGSAELESCGFEDCQECHEVDFVCSRCREIFMADRLELEYLRHEEEALLQRLEEVRHREKGLAAYLRQ